MCRCRECSKLWAIFVALRDDQMLKHGRVLNSGNAAYWQWIASTEAHTVQRRPWCDPNGVQWVDRLVATCREKQTRATDHLIVALGKKVYDHHPEGWSWFYTQPEAERLWDAQEREHNRHMARYDRNRA